MSFTAVPAAHREVRLVAHPEGEVTTRHFRIAEVAVPRPGPGQVLVRNRVMVVTAAMRTQMSGVRLPMPSFVPGEALWGSAVGEVVAAPDGDFEPGELVRHPYGWREFAVVDVSRIRRLAPDALPVAAHLSQGTTAWGALRRAAGIRAGDTVFVTGAAGGVGSMAGQLARRLGAGRVVGSTGSERKAARLRAELGYDDTVVRGAGTIERQLRRAAPDGIDVLLDTVGGEQLTAALTLARTDARFALVGALSTQLGGDGGISAPVELDAGLVITRRVALRGFGLHAHPDLPEEWTKEFGQGLRDGSLTFPHALLRGIERAPQALCELVQGRHIGAVVVEM
ncbi:MDR family NADP-dependent oxidoreductase [Streptomyces sp. NPDC091266]|uniref:MDR family NADP-dependent oxidoreductase n=1 Tax=Streptomyces sp. NPDC091266 TaxID=3365978 RepID=UPI003817BDA4